jgi:hypothetical protein
VFPGLMSSRLSAFPTLAFMTPILTAKAP